MGKQFLQQIDNLAFQKIREIIYRKYGIYFRPDKFFSLKHKLNRRMRALGIDSPPEYLEYLNGKTDEIPFLLDEVSTNKTFFFREASHWHFFQRKILPSVTEHIVDYRIWSAACSSGEEAYSAAMIVDDYCTVAGRERLTYKVLGTDLSASVLNRAISGRYGRADLKDVKSFSKEYARRYFEKDAKTGGLRMKENIKKRVFFRQFNLREKNYPFKDRFDLIICRNVLIYFDAEMVQHTINELTKALKPGGYMFIGHTEHLNNIKHSLKRIRPAIYRKR